MKKLLKINLLLTAVFLSLFFIFGCSNQANQKEKNVQEASISVKELAEGNSYIEMNVDVFKHMNQVNVLTKSQGDDLKKAKAIVYRFYKHVTLSNEEYKLQLEDPETLNFSPEIYKVLVENLKEMNRCIADAKAKGRELYVAPVNEEYLNSLIK